MGDDHKPVRVTAALQPNEVAEYTLSINIVVTPPAFDEKRIRKLIDDEFNRLGKTCNNSR